MSSTQSRLIAFLTIEKDRERREREREEAEGCGCNDAMGKLLHCHSLSL